MRTATPVRNIYISVTGIAGRDRKEKRHMVELGNRDIQTTVQDVEAEARAELVKFKSVRSAILHLSWMEIETDDESPGTKIQRFQMFDPRHVSVKLV